MNVAPMYLMNDKKGQAKSLSFIFDKEMKKE